MGDSERPRIPPDSGDVAMEQTVSSGQTARDAVGTGAPAFAAMGRRSGPVYSHRPTFGALDLGTNNCRLLIARPDGDDFIIVDAYSRIVRLGEGMNASGRLSEAAMDRALAALSVCAEKLRRRRVLLSRSVATEACRRADNGADFVERVREETGIVLDIISPAEEARLAVLGCHQALSKGNGNGPALIFDIGGGSTELVLVGECDGEPEILEWMSVPWGVVSLTEAERYEDAGEPVRLAAFEAMRGRVRSAFATFAERIARHFPGGRPDTLRLLGTSGTVTTLASLHLELSSYDRSRVDGLNVATSDLRAISLRLARMSLHDRALLPCIGQERADLVVSGCAVLEEICTIWPAERLDVADRGIREGVLRQLMRGHAAHRRERQR